MRHLKKRAFRIGLTLLTLLLLSCGLLSCSGDTDMNKPDTTNETAPVTEPGEKKTNFSEYAEADASYINKNTLRFYCCTNEALIPSGKKVTGFVLEFPGLDGNSCLGGLMGNMSTYDNAFTRTCAENGIVVAYTFPGPWSFMNRGAVRVTDLVVDALMDKYGFTSEDDFTLIVMGGSMGGQSALIYTADSKHTVDACAAHCPTYDILARIRSGDVSVPRAFLSAVNDYDMPLDDALKAISPAHRIADMPDVPYLVTADELDEILPVKGIEKYVDALKEAGFDVTYLRLDGKKHGEISAEDRNTMNDFILRHSGIGG